MMATNLQSQLTLRGVHSLTPSDYDNGPHAPVCETCRREMTLLATLPRMGNRPCVRVYKCLPCGRIEPVYEN
jgi:hypothetical protein